MHSSLQLTHFSYRLAILLFSLAMLSCQPKTLSEDQVKSHSPRQLDEANGVNAHDYDSFWLWGNVSPKPYLTNRSKPTELYILQGEVGQAHPLYALQQANGTLKTSILQSQGMGLCHIKSTKIWLVYRTTTLDWHPDMMRHMVARLNSWQNYGNDVVGLQIDFDSATGQLSQYAKFLNNVRQQLPKSYQLSATGLLDWVNADKQNRMLLKSTLNEVVIQTYQGKHTVSDYQAYLPTLARMDIPFKVGLVQHGQWQPYPPIEKNENFKGYVVFLLRTS